MPVAIVRRIASPSTGMMCTVARSDGLVCPPRPGAAIVWCGTHVEILHSPMGPNVWRTIGGNSGDAVRFRTRSLDDALIYGPPGLEEIVAVPKRELLYWLEDEGAEYEVKGPWGAKASAERTWRGLEPNVRRRAKLVRTGDKKYALRIGEPRHYGPWVGDEGKAIRARSRKMLEQRLGRRLRPYRTSRMPLAPGAVKVEALGKTT